MKNLILIIKLIRAGWMPHKFYRGSILLSKRFWPDRISYRYMSPKSAWTIEQRKRLRMQP